jgi:LPXTG-motif cell wall-anchored protein
MAATDSGSSDLAFTGLGDDTPVLLVSGIAMILIGVLGRRRFVGLPRRAKRGSQMQ